MAAFRMALPEGAARILGRLRERGHRAYAVGGCVRDSLLGLTPKDYDICTSATPEEMLDIFRGWHVAETGLKHGTLTVVWAHVPYEVTTFRVETGYSDHRHPDAVAFVGDVREDLARRDFTVNAMAWNPEEGLIDLFGGAEDLRAGIVRCVGEPAARFGEDALRILRALRFASVYGFRIEERTAAAARALKDTLAEIAPERIRAELEKLLCGAGVRQILMDYPEIVTGILPELAPMVGFQQLTPYHRYDVWEHTARTVEAAPPEPVLRWTMLLHDSGKPACFTVDERGVGHAYGHPKVSVEIADRALRFLRTDNATREHVTALVARHDQPLPPERKALTRLLNRLGEEDARRLIEVQRADNLGKGTADPAEVEAKARTLREALDALLAEKPCFTLRDLAVGGSDLIGMGFPKGPVVGETLRALLERVIDGELANEKAALLTAAREYRE